MKIASIEGDQCDLAGVYGVALQMSKGWKDGWECVCISSRIVTSSASTSAEEMESDIWVLFPTCYTITTD
jgi:hypothetical protein